MEYSHKFAATRGLGEGSWVVASLAAGLSSENKSRLLLTLLDVQSDESVLIPLWAAHMEAPVSDLRRHDVGNQEPRLTGKCSISLRHIDVTETLALPSSNHQGGRFVSGDTRCALRYS